MTNKWRLILETEHGKLFRSEKGTLKVQVTCSQCDRPIEGVQRGSVMGYGSILKEA